MLWEMIANVNIHPEVKDSIIWKLPNGGSYTTSSAYMAQFARVVYSNLQDMVWKVWSPPKCNFFAWLVTQNRIWTADRLQRRGWPNCDQYPLCSQVQESAANLLFKCRFATRIWKEVFSWLDLQVDTTNWHIFTTVKAWWQGIINIAHQRKALSSLIHLVGCEIWKKKGTRAALEINRHRWPPLLTLLKRRHRFGLLQVPSIYVM